MSMMGENTVLKQHKLSGAKSKKQSNYDSNVNTRRNIRQTMNNLKTHSNQNLAHQQNVQNAKNKFDEKHNIHLSKMYSDTIDQTPSLNQKIARYENISRNSKQTENYEDTAVAHRKCKKNMITYSKDCIGDNVPINKYKVIFYKDLCISGKDMSLWKKIKSRLRSRTSVKVSSHTYVVSTGLSRTLSTCDNPKSNDIKNHLKIINNLEKTKDNPFSKNYTTMHLNVEKSNTQQDLIDDSNVIYSKSEGEPCMNYDTSCMKLPVLNFSESSVHYGKNPIKDILKTNISEIIKDTLANILEKRNTQCDKIISTNSSKLRSGENRKICVQKSKCVAADTDCKDKCISNQNEVMETCVLCKYEDNTKSLQSSNINYCNVKTITEDKNKNKPSQVRKCKCLSKNIQGIFGKCKSTKTTGKLKCYKMNTSSPNKKSKTSENVRRKYEICKNVKTQFVAPSEDYINQLIKKKHGKSCGSQCTKSNRKKSQQIHLCKPIKRKSNENLTCGTKLIENNLNNDEKPAPPVCRNARIQFSSAPKHVTNGLICKKKTHKSGDFQKINYNCNTKSSKQANFRNLLNLKPKEKLPRGYNQVEKLLSCAENKNLKKKERSHHSRNQPSVSTKHVKCQLSRRKSCNSYDPCPSKPLKKHGRHSETYGKMYMKNANTQSKNIRSDMDLRCKESSSRRDSCSQSCCRSVRNHSNSCSAQCNLTLKNRAMSRFESHVGDYTNNSKCLSCSCSSNTQQHRQSEYCLDSLLTSQRPQCVSDKYSLKRQVLHDRSCCTIPQKQYCKSCLTSLTCLANGQTKFLDSGTTPLISCTELFNITSSHKPITKCASKKICQRKIQTCLNLQRHLHKNRCEHNYPRVSFFRKIKNCYLYTKIKRSQKQKCSRSGNACDVDFDRNKLYEYAFRPDPVLSCMRPVSSPNSYNRKYIWQQCSEQLGLICVLCICSPLLYLFQFFRMCD